MKTISLTQGLSAIVDSADFEGLNQFNWCAAKRKSKWYALRSIQQPNGRWKTFYMHQIILPIKEGYDTDHKNGNGLDNQRENLRYATRQGNSTNRRKSPNQTSKYKGVSWNLKQKKWRAFIYVDSKQFYLGSFDYEKDAALAYDSEAQKLFGEFSNLNFSPTKLVSG